MNRRVLLVMPPGWVRISPMAPLGLAEISAVLHDNGIECTTVDLEIQCYLRSMSQGEECDDLVMRLTEPLPSRGGIVPKNNAASHEFSEILNMLPLDGVSLVAFSVMGQRQWAASSRIAADLRGRGFLTAVGGCYVATHPDEVSAAKIFDFAFPMLSLDSFLDICRRLPSGVRTDGTTTLIDTDNSNPPIHPTPSYPVDLGMYGGALADMYGTSQRHTILQYGLDRGCVWNCSFCVRQRIGKYAHVPVKDVVKSIAELAERHETKTFALVTNAININTRYSKSLFRALAEANIGLEWYAYATPCRIDSDLIDDMARSGCRFIRLGIESGSDRVLKSMKKGFKTADAEYCLRQFHRSGIWTQVNFIFGYPGEDDLDADLSTSFVDRNNEFIDSIRINPFYLQQGSDIFNKPEHYGITVVEQDGKRIAFDEIHGKTYRDKCEATVDFIDSMYEVMKAHGIGYTGISVNLLLCALVEHSSRRDANSWLRRKHPFLFENLSYEEIRWRIYHRRELARNPFGDSWTDLYGTTFEEKSGANNEG